jgi:hypothetical protein
MGYYIRQRDANFMIKAENKEKALKAIKDLTNTKSGNDSFSWVDMDNARNTDILKEAFEAWRWASFDDPDGNINDIRFCGEKSGDCNKLFTAIAPYVEKGSFIEMSGEEGEIWQWVFNGKTMEEKYATITF